MRKTIIMSGVLIFFIIWGNNSMALQRLDNNTIPKIDSQKYGKTMTATFSMG